MPIYFAPIDHGTNVQVAIRDWLIGELSNPDGPWITLFAAWASTDSIGVDVMLVADQPSAETSTLRPRIVITLEDDKAEPSGVYADNVPAWGTSHSWTFKLSCEASATCGAITGASNPVSSHKRVRDAVIELVRANYVYLRDSLGLTQAEIKSGAETMSGANYSVPCTLQCVTYTTL